MKRSINSVFSESLLKLAADEVSEEPVQRPGPSLDNQIQNKLRNASRQAKLLDALFSKYGDDPDVSACISAIKDDVSFVQRALSI